MKWTQCTQFNVSIHSGKTIYTPEEQSSKSARNERDGTNVRDRISVPLKQTTVHICDTF